MTKKVDAWTARDSRCGLAYLSPIVWRKTLLIDMGGVCPGYLRLVLHSRGAKSSGRVFFDLGTSTLDVGYAPYIFKLGLSRSAVEINAVFHYICPSILCLHLHGDCCCSTKRVAGLDSDHDVHVSA